MIMIYKYTEIYSGKVYIGQTSTTMKERQKLGYKKCFKLYNCISQYMEEDNISEIDVLDKYFTTDILVQINDNNQVVADIIEQKYIEINDSINKGFNYLPGGKNSYIEHKLGLQISSINELRILQNRIIENNIKEMNTFDINLFNEFLNTGRIIVQYKSKKGKDHKREYKTINSWLNVFPEIKRKNIASIIFKQFMNGDKTLRFERYNITF